MNGKSHSASPGQWPDCPLEVASLLFFDIETSGLRPDRGARIMEIAVVDNSRCRFQWEADSEADGDKSVSEWLPVLFDELAKGVVVGHNVGFDFHFVAYEANRLGYAGPEVRFIDTLGLARRVVEVSDYSLETLVDRFDIDVDGELHTALVDARATRDLFWRLVEEANLATLSDAGMKPLNWATF